MYRSIKQCRNLACHFFEMSNKWREGKGSRKKEMKGKGRWVRKRVRERDARVSQLQCWPVSPICMLYISAHLFATDKGEPQSCNLKLIIIKYQLSESALHPVLALNKNVFWIIIRREKRFHRLHALCALSTYSMP